MNPPKGRILYIEDDPDSRELIRYVFTRGGYEVICAESSREALHLAKQEHFDLFLLDNWLPDVTGLELTRCIREFDQTLRSFSIPVPRLRATSATRSMQAHKAI